MSSPADLRPPRLNSLDQFRGYTVAAMFLVNFLGGYEIIPAILRHHNTWCSFADTVMPQFVFAAGMALRLVTLREMAKHGRAAALCRGFRRSLALLLLGLFWYGPRGFHDWQEMADSTGSELMRNVFLTHAFQALTHIGATSLWVLPVMAASGRAALLWGLASAGLHLWLSHWFWYDRLHQWGVVDGGPLGFLSWTVPFLAGSFAFDVLMAAGRGNPAAAPVSEVLAGPRYVPDDRPHAALPKPDVWQRLLPVAAGLMAAGYGLSCLTAGGVLAAPPFAGPWHGRDMWTMSQRAGSVSYLTFCAGFSLMVFAFFHWWSDLRGKSLTLFTDLGRNALAAYLVHGIAMNFTERLGPRDAPLAWALSLSAGGFLITWFIVRRLNAQGLYLRL